MEVTPLIQPKPPEPIDFMKDLSEYQDYRNKVANEAATKQATQRSTLETNHNQMLFTAKQLGSLLAKPGPLTPEDAQAQIDSIHQGGATTDQQWQNARGAFKPGMSDSEVRDVLNRMNISTLDGVAQRTAIYGRPGEINQGSQIQPGTFDPQTNAFRPAGDAIGVGPSPDTLIQPHKTTVVAPDGTQQPVETTVGGNAQSLGVPTGPNAPRPSSAAQGSLYGSGGYRDPRTGAPAVSPAPAVAGSPPAPQGPVAPLPPIAPNNALQPAPASPAPPVPTAPPGFRPAGPTQNQTSEIEQDQKRYNDDSGRQRDLANQDRILTSAYGLMKDITTGPGSQTVQQIRSRANYILNQLGMNNPAWADKITNMDEAKKYFATIASMLASGQQVTDAGLQRQYESSPNFDMSNGANQKLLLDRLGQVRRDRATYANAPAGIQGYRAHSDKVANGTDLRGFTDDAAPMTLEEFEKLTPAQQAGIVEAHRLDAKRRAGQGGY